MNLFFPIFRIPLTRQEEVKIDLTEFHWTPDLF